jgi:hypothetical protein
MSISERDMGSFYAPGSWIQFRRGMPEACRGNFQCAWLLAHLIGLSYMTQAYERNGGWFYRKDSLLIAELGITKETLYRYIRMLQNWDFLEVSRRGFPAIRHFRLRMWEIHQSCVEAERSAQRAVSAAVEEEARLERERKTTICG